MKMKLLQYVFCISGALFFLESCSSDDNGIIQDPDPVILSPNVEVFNPDLIDDGYVLAIENGGTESYLLNKAGHKVVEWSFDIRLGNDLELLSDGKLIGMFKTEDPHFSFGGYGGIVKILNLDGSSDWEFEYASPNYIAHHDVEMLPNGNVLFLVWERITAAQAQLAGVDTTIDIFPEVLVEVNPTSNQIVWEWHSFDHIVQNVFPTMPNFGNLSDNPQRININHHLPVNGDIMHANGIDFDSVNNVIYMSVNGYSEIWVIDHSTSIVEAASNSGGNYNKGGDILYRFGNPEAYEGLGARLFYNNHFPNLLEGDEPGAGNILVYVNGGNIEQSTIYELKMPELFSLSTTTANEPEIVWSFTNTELFYDRISGAVRLNNGNTLICEGDYGFWEVTPNKDIVWKYNGQGTNYWRCYGYASDAVELSGFNL